MIQRYWVQPGALHPHDNGEFVTYADHFAIVSEQGKEIAGLYEQLASMAEAAAQDVKLLIARAEQAEARIAAAAEALGYGDD